MIALARLVGRIMSNTSVRVAVNLSLEQKQNLKAGTSVGQFDLEGGRELTARDEAIVYDVSKSLIKNFNDLIKANAKLLLH